MKLYELAYLGEEQPEGLAALTTDRDPLRTAAVLQESTVIGLQHDAIMSRAVLHLNCKGALGVDVGSTAILVVEAVSDLAWNQQTPRNEGRKDFSIVGWSVTQEGAGVKVVALLDPSAALTVAGATVRFFLGSVQGDELPGPNYATVGDEEIRASVASWNSDIVLKAYSQRAAVWAPFLTADSRRAGQRHGGTSRPHGRNWNSIHDA